MNDRIRSLLMYSLKCVLGTLTVFIVSSLIHYTDIGWCLISVILVLSPDGKDSVTLGITRLKGNVVGACVGAACLFVSPTNMWILSAGIVLTLSLCYLFKLDNGVRSALAATIIIMLHEGGKHMWDTAIERIIAVLAGCSLGLLITYLFHFRNRSEVRPSAKDQAETSS